jgi:predicted phosphodiesterase
MIEKLKKITVIPYEYINDFLETNNPFIYLDVTKPTFIIGDLHQDENSFFSILEATQFFEKDINLIFLGDYVDRGINIWLINKLLYLRKEFKDRVFLLRGNHETSENSKVLTPVMDDYSFFNQLNIFKVQYPEYINDNLIEFYKYFFETLPIGMILKFNDFRYFLTHGNIPRIDLKKGYPKKLENFLRLNNCIGISYINDFLWNDIGNNNYTSKVRYEVSKDEINYFLYKFNFDYIVRAHQYVKEGFRIDDRVITVFSNGRNSPISRKKNLNSAYNGIPAVFEITSGKIYQVDIFLKKLVPVKTIFYTNYKKKNFHFPTLNVSSDLCYLGNSNKIYVTDLYTNKKQMFLFKNEITYRDLESFYGIDIKFRIILKDDFIINKSKKPILVDGKFLKPSYKRKIVYPLFVNHLKIDIDKKRIFLRKKVFSDFKVKFINLRKKGVLSRYKFNYSKR